MSFLGRNVFKIISRTEGCSRVQASKFHWTTSHYLHKRTTFSEAEELLIVNTINKSLEGDFSKFNIKPAQLKKLLEYRERNGKFNTFNDVLITQDVPSFVKLCTSILNGGNKSSTVKVSIPPKTAVTPALHDVECKKLKNIVGLEIFGNNISWAMLNENNHLSDWNCEKFEVTSKSSLVPLVNLIMKIATRIPHADAYVMEADPYTSLSKLKGPTLFMHLQRQQVIATLISILGIRRRSDVSELVYVNNFYMLQAQAAARHFKLNIGNEKISSGAIVSEILSGKTLDIVSVPVTVDPETMKIYQLFDLSTREQLNSSLLISLTFFDAVRKKMAVERKIDPKKDK